MGEAVPAMTASIGRNHMIVRNRSLALVASAGLLAAGLVPAPATRWP